MVLPAVFAVSYTHLIEMFPTGFNEYNGGYDYYLEHNKPEIIATTVKADSENKAAYKENKKNKADGEKFVNRPIFDNSGSLNIGHYFP